MAKNFPDLGIKDWSCFSRNVVTPTIFTRQIHPTFFAEMDRNSGYEVCELVNHLVST